MKALVVFVTVLIASAIVSSDEIPKELTRGKCDKFIVIIQ